MVRLSDYPIGEVYAGEVHMVIDAFLRCLDRGSRGCYGTALCSAVRLQRHPASCSRARQSTRVHTEEVIINQPLDVVLKESEQKSSITPSARVTRCQASPEPTC
jgi:hypothetical protein